MDIWFVYKKEEFNMIGLVILLSVIGSYFVMTIDLMNAIGQSEGRTIRLQSIPTPEERADSGKVKEQWFEDFSELLNESTNNSTIDG